MDYIVSQRALDRIALECRRNPDTETGGILVGLRQSDQLSITHATGPGLQWQGSAYHFVKDTQYLQSVLNLLFEYFGVNYLGVWHKHPESLPHPSDGDISSAMEEVDDKDLRLEELVTPICVMDSGQVQIFPFVIKERGYRAIKWTPIEHEKIMGNASLGGQWYETASGSKRLIEELARFEEAGIDVELLKGNDKTYRVSVPLSEEPNRRLVILCPAEYPVIAPEVAAHDENGNYYEPLRTKLLDNWNILVYLADVVVEHQAVLSDPKVVTRRGLPSAKPLPPRNWVRDGHTVAKILCFVARKGVTVARWPNALACRISNGADRLEKWFEERDRWDCDIGDDGLCKNQPADDA